VKLLVPPDGTRERTVAAGAAAVLNHTGHQTWGEFAEAFNQRGPVVLNGLTVDEDTRRLMDSLAWITNRVTINVTIAQCDRCHGVVFERPGGKDLPCLVTVGCGGAMVRPRPAQVREIDERTRLPGM
jgi:hypothetical protein